MPLALRHLLPKNAQEKHRGVTIRGSGKTSGDEQKTKTTRKSGGTGTRSARKRKSRTESNKKAEGVEAGRRFRFLSEPGQRNYRTISKKIRGSCPVLSSVRRVEVSLSAQVHLRHGHVYFYQLPTSTVRCDSNILKHFPRFITITFQYFFTQKKQSKQMLFERVKSRLRFPH